MGVDISQWRLAVGCHLHRGVTKHRSKNSGKAITRKDVLEEAMNLLRPVPSLIVLILGGLLLVNFSPSSLEYHLAHQFSDEFTHDICTRATMTASIMEEDTTIKDSQIDVS